MQIAQFVALDESIYSKIHKNLPNETVILFYKNKYLYELKNYMFIKIFKDLLRYVQNFQFKHRIVLFLYIFFIYLQRDF